MTTARIWFSTAQAAEYAGRHPVTIRAALEAGELHGTQRKRGGRWRMHVACLDAWLGGVECEHQKAGAA
jgi:excisionase family DNA binding protein